MGASTLELTEENFEAAVKKNGILFIDFWAQWCGPCRAFAPTYEAAAAKYPDIIFGKVNTEEQKGLAASFEISAIPTLAVFREGVLLLMEAGAMSSKTLDLLVQKVRDIDMAEIRKTIADLEKKNAPK